MSPETALFESPRPDWGATVIVVELLGGFGGAVVEVVVGVFGVELHHPFSGGDLEVVDVALDTALGALGPDVSSFLNEPTAVSTNALFSGSPTEPPAGPRLRR